ncbi:MAG: hypothetical protein GX589_07705, partial [Deltaproteobacteria bacterium]|nr:hypothetical protein [Deltaproteobacteria bacterium]
MLERQLNQRDNHENTGYHELRSSLLVAVRTCLLAVALVAASIYGVYVRHESWASISYFYPHFALLFGFCALSGLWIAWKTTGTFFICLQFAVDIAVVTGVVYATGGPISPLIFLYLPIVMGAAVVSSVYVALGITVLNLAAYAALLWGLSSGQIPMFDEGAVLELP